MFPNYSLFKTKIFLCWKAWVKQTWGETVCSSKCSIFILCAGYSFRSVKNLWILQKRLQVLRNLLQTSKITIPIVSVDFVSELRIEELSVLCYDGYQIAKDTVWSIDLYKLFSLRFCYFLTMLLVIGLHWTILLKPPVLWTLALYNLFHFIYLIEIASSTMVFSNYAFH